MSDMSDLIFDIPNIIIQRDQSESIGSASALYNKFYKALETWESGSEEPTISEMSEYSKIIIDCFDFSFYDMLKQYIKDLLFFNIVNRISSLSSGKYGSILDSIKNKWTDYQFTKIDEYHTFSSIEGE